MANNRKLEVTLAFSADTRNAQSQLKNLQNELSKLSNTPININSKNYDSLKAASLAAGELQVHLKNAINQDTGKLDFTKLSKSFKEAGTSAEDYAKALLEGGEQGRRAFNELTDAIASSEIPLKKTNKLLDETWKSLKNAVKWQISSQIVDSFASGIRNAYDYAQDLNKSLNNIRIVTGQNIDQMAKFAEKANKAARNLSTTTTEYTDAALIYYQQGLSDSEVEERTNVTVKLANVTGESAQQVSDQLTAIWNNFDDGTKSLEYYADVITNLGAATASSTDEISAGLEKFASVADTVGLSYEYATSALATVTSTTRQSADVVGTAFKTLFARIQDLELGETLDDGTTLGKYSAALDAVGINIKDSNGELRDMDDILDDMGEKWKTLNKDQQVSLAQTVAGTRQYTQLVALMDEWDYFQENLNTAYGSTGALQEQADIYEESWQAASDRVKAALESIYSDLINDDFFIGILNSLETIIGYADNLIDSFGGLGGVLTTVGSIATKVFNKQIAQSMRDTADGVRRYITGGKREKQEKQKTQENLEQEGSKETGRQKEGDIARGNIRSNMADIRETIAKKSEFLNETDKEILEMNLNQLRALNDEYIKFAESIDQATEEIEELKNVMETGSGSDVYNNENKKTQLNEMLTEYYKLEEARKSGNKEQIDQSKKKFEEFKIDVDVDKNKLSAIHKKIIDHFVKQEPIVEISIKADKKKIKNTKKAIEELNKEIEEINKITGENSPKIDLIKDDEIKNTKTYTQKLEELKQKVQEYNNVQKATQETAENEAEQYAQAVSNKIKMQQQENKLKTEANASADQIRKGLESKEKPKADWADYFTNITQAATSLTSIMTTTNGLMETWGDETKSAGEKILPTLTAIGTTGVSSILGISSALEALGMSNPWMMGITAILTALSIAIPIVSKLIDDAIETSAEKMERLEATSQELNNKLDETKTRANDIKSSFDQYDSIREKLDSCTQGTKEWNEALRENNLFILDLLQKYPELLEFGAITKDTKGNWTLDENKLQEYLDKIVQDSFLLQTSADLAETTAQYQKTKRDIESDSLITLGNEAGYYSLSDEEIIKIAREALNEQDLVEKLNKFYTGKGLVVDFEEAKKTYSDAFISANEPAYNQAIESAKNLYKNGEFQNLLNNWEQNESGLNQQTTMIADMALQEGTDIEKAIFARNLQNYAKTENAELLDFSLIDNNMVQTALGDDYRVDSSGQLQKLVGNEWKAYTDLSDSQRAALAPMLLQKQTENQSQEIIKALEQVENPVAKAILEGQDLSSIGDLGDINTVKQSLESLDPEIKSLLGIDQNWIDSQINNLNSLSEEQARLKNTLSKSGVDVEGKDYSLQELKNIEKATLTAPKLMESAGEDAAKMAQILAEADTEEEINNISNALKENGINIDENNQYLRAWKNGALAAIKSGKTYTERLAEINEELAKYGIDEDALDQMKDYLKEINPELAEHEEALTEAARKQILLSTGLNDLTTNADNYSKILEILQEDELLLASPENLEQLNALKTSIVQVLDVDPQLIDNNFLIEHLEEINRLSKGDIKVLEELRKEMAINTVTKTVKMDDSELQDFINRTNNLDLDEIEVGAVLDSSKFANGLINMMQKAGASTKVIQDYFNSLGVTLKPKTETITLATAVYGNNDEATQNGALVMGGGTTVWGSGGSGAGVQVETVDGIFAGWEVVGKDSPNIPTTTTKGGGGGSTPAKKDTKQPVKADDHVERYKEINDILDDLNETYDDLNSQTDRYFGANRIQALKNEATALKDINKALRHKYELNQQYLESDRQIADSYGFTFDENGNINNYTDKMTDYVDAVNKATDDYNAAINNYNANIGAEDMNVWEQAIETAQKGLDNANEQLTQAKDAVSQYDESREQMEDLSDEIRDNTYAIQDLNADIVAYTLEMKLLVSEIKMDDIELEIGNLEVFDSFFDLAEKLDLESSKRMQYLDDMKSYTDAFLQIEGLYRRGSELLLPATVEGTLQKALDRIAQVEAGENKKTYTDANRNDILLTGEGLNTESTVSQAAYIEQIQEVREGLMKMLKNIQELDKAMLEYYGDTLDKANTELQKHTVKLERLTSVLNHYKSLMDILGKETDYENIGLILEGQANAIKNEMEVAESTFKMYENEVLALRDELSKAEAGTYMYKLVQRQLEEAETAMAESQENMYAKTEEWLGLMKSILENDMAKAARAFEKALTGGTSFDQLAQTWDRANSLQEDYLTNTNKIYETTKLMRKAEQELDKTSNEAAKNRLSAFIKETQQLQDQGKLSNYELQVQQAKYDLLLAEIALEEARNAKSVVRLQRDNEGNYGYVYTADQDKISDAEQKVADAENSLYNISLEGQIEYGQKYQQLMQQFYEEWIALQTNYQNGGYESEEQYLNAKNELEAYFNELGLNYLDIYNIATQTSTEAVNDAWTTNLMDMIAKQDEWTQASGDYLKQSTDAFEQFESAIDTVEEKLGIDFDSMSLAIKDVTDKSDALATTIKDTVIPQITKEIEEVRKSTEEYGIWRTEADDTIKKAEALATAIGGIVTQATDATSGVESLTIAINSLPNEKTVTVTYKTVYEPDNNNNNTPKDKDNNTSDSSNNEKDTSQTPSCKTSCTGSCSSSCSGGCKVSAKAGCKACGGTCAGDCFTANTSKEAIKYYLEGGDKFNTGGYTGAWGPEGKLAILHEKEIVLNKEDTENLLASIQMVRDYIHAVDFNTNSSLMLNPRMAAASINPNSTQLDQNVTIEANFPSVTDRNEIEEALKSLVNRASQYINR